jgi:hypothetical protein
MFSEKNCQKKCQIEPATTLVYHPHLVECSLWVAMIFSGQFLSLLFDKKLGNFWKYFLF